MTGRNNLSPGDFEQAWDLLKFRIAEKTSWGKKEILGIMETIEALMAHEKAHRFRNSHDSRRR